MWLSVSTSTQWDRVSAVFPLSWSSATCSVGVLCVNHRLSLGVSYKKQNLSHTLFTDNSVFALACPDCVDFDIYSVSV